MRTVVQVLLLVAFVIAAAVAYGEWHWNSATRDLQARIDAGNAPSDVSTFDSREIESLPAPVQRYFRAVLPEGQPIVSTADFEHRGTFNMSETAEQWKRFRSRQHVVTRPPGFVWDARVSIMPGVAVFAHDGYDAGEGFLHASALGLVTITKERGAGDLAHGELIRFLSECVWYPTALLPSQGVRWQSIGDTTARATLADGDLSVSVDYHFGPDGLIDMVLVSSRGRATAGDTQPTPWQGRFWNYERRDGMLIPTDGEVAWITQEGPQTYWRGHLEEITYGFDR